MTVPVINGEECVETEHSDRKDRVIEHTWHTPRGSLTELTRDHFAGSTLVQEPFPITRIPEELPTLHALLADRRWRFKSDKYTRWQAAAGDDGFINAGSCPRVYVVNCSGVSMTADDPESPLSPATR